MREQTAQVGKVHLTMENKYYSTDAYVGVVRTARTKSNLQASR